MKKPYKKILWWLLGLVLVFMIGLLTVDFIIKNKVEKFLQDGLPDHITATHKDIDVSSLGGSLAIADAALQIKNKLNGQEHTVIKTDLIELAGLRYWNYLFGGEIHLDALHIKDAEITYYPERAKTPQDSTQNSTGPMDYPILIDRTQIENVNLAIYENEKDSTRLYISGLSVEVEDLLINSETLRQKIPFQYKDYSAQSDTIFVKVNPFDNFTAGQATIKKGKAVFHDLSLKTKYSKKALSKIIKTERDHYDLEISTLSIADMDFGFKADSFYAQSAMVRLEKPQFVIYRDKLVADDQTIKPLYSKMLRDLPFQLTVDSLKIAQANITYEERTQEENMGGTIKFKDLNAAIARVGNTYEAPEKTELKINAEFMGSTPFEVHWSFDVNDRSDHFLFKADVGHLEARRMNQFTEPNLKVRLEGHTDRAYFTIDGNNETSTTDLKIKYSDFKVTILQKDGKEKNSFLSSIANIFIAKNSEKKSSEFKEGTGHATRNKTKSIFNFLWISLEKALENVML